MEINVSKASSFVYTHYTYIIQTVGMRKNFTICIPPEGIHENIAYPGGMPIVNTKKFWYRLKYQK